MCEQKNISKPVEKKAKMIGCQRAKVLLTVINWLKKSLTSALLLVLVNLNTEPSGFKEGLETQEGADHETSLCACEKVVKQE